MEETLLHRFSEILYQENVSNWINYWKRVYQETPATENLSLNDEITFFNRPSAEEQKMLFNIVKRTAIDSTSVVLGILDGTSGIDITSFDPEVYINGMYTNMKLQDTFLEFVETYGGE